MRCEIKSHDVRTADNVLMLCRSELKVEAALETIRDWIEQGGLTLHSAKAKIVDCHAESLATKKAQLVELTPRKRSGSIESIAWELNPILIDCFTCFVTAAGKSSKISTQGYTLGYGDC